MCEGGLQDLQTPAAFPDHHLQLLHGALTMAALKSVLVKKKRRKPAAS